MKTRREAIKLIAMSGFAGNAFARGLRMSSPASGPIGEPRNGLDDRSDWCAVTRKLAMPVLSASAHRKLKATMPVEARNPEEREPYAHLEAVCRLLCGIAPWIELGGDPSQEGADRARIAELARAGIDAITDPQSPDFMSFSKPWQPLVEAAFLSQALLRAPNELWGKLDRRVKANVIAALKATRAISPGENNWKLFATTVEVFLQSVGEIRDDTRLFEGLRRFGAWYVGDGHYGDGPEFRWDYYNAFVIQPMLLEALEVVGEEAEAWRMFRSQARERLSRYAAIQERLIAPDGSYPVIGRSIAYRCGAFQALALAALRHMLPENVEPAQARAALTAMIRRTMGAPGTFDADGWLRIGIAGHQPSVGEGYISTGSLYLCSAALLPLGLPQDDAFWSGPPAKTTWEKAWSGVNIPADKALRNPRQDES